MKENMCAGMWPRSLPVAQFVLVDNDVDGVDDTATGLLGGTVETLRDVGKVLVKDGHAIDEIVGLATVAEYVFQSPYLVVSYLHLPAFDLRLVEQADEGVLVTAVVVEREREGFAAGVHASLGEVETAFPGVPDDAFSGKLDEVAHFLPVGIVLFAAAHREEDDCGHECC